MPVLRYPGGTQHMLLRVGKSDIFGLQDGQKRCFLGPNKTEIMFMILFDIK